jgi:hypothetical protein
VQGQEPERGNKDEHIRSKCKGKSSTEMHQMMTNY